MKIRSCLRAALVVALGILRAQAATTINIDFNTSDGSAGTYSGTAAAPDTGTVWNGVVTGAESGSPLLSSFTSGPLVNSTGGASSVTVTLGNFRSYDGNERPATLAPGLLTDFVYQQTLGHPDRTPRFPSITSIRPTPTISISIPRTRATRIPRPFSPSTDSRRRR